MNATHYFSAGAVCFSRAVNDTPKIAALLLASNAHSTYTALACVAAAMAAGGLIQSRRVAETMSRRITDLNPGQGLCANLVTAGLVLIAYDSVYRCLRHMSLVAPFLVLGSCNVRRVGGPSPRLPRHGPRRCRWRRLWEPFSIDCRYHCTLSDSAIGASKIGAVALRRRGAIRRYPIPGS